ncbi:MULTISPECIES: hypothetical protein [Fictibacillus]|uniref:Uncharacterized protein n=1 Tax=Fictibacillus enclensis TaxID=1017270 RepID=A0A0V8J4C5_9BACL|nr:MULTISPECIES: hypothetical protein [Fictibacillus]KSU81786.1 hypothetical protein AS030_15980 [Fictibacillus enclensis]MDM5201445.1 hypothetical protein [Fictibacillus enclensis]RXZ01214.1 hypothetical protein DMO16_17105 [Fictibacillus sp. S7]SCC26094.1 hypothetical protein GA0061096_3368 [Fictibacillus enclensis]
MNRNLSKTLKWISGGYEALLGIPFVGGTIVLSFAWTPLALALALHIVTLIFASKEGTAKHGSITGIVTSCIAWIPFVGMIMHIITAILLMVDAYKQEDIDDQVVDTQ